MADSSLAFDLEAKARFYAAARIPHYWVIDVQAPRLHVVGEQSGGLDADRMAALRRAVEAVLRELPRP